MLFSKYYMEIWCNKNVLYISTLFSFLISTVFTASVKLGKGGGVTLPIIYSHRQPKDKYNSSIWEGRGAYY